MLSESSWKPDAVLRLFLGVLICLFVGALLANVVRHYSGTLEGMSPWRAVAAALCFQGVALVFVQRFLRDHEMRWAQAFGFSNDRTRALMLGAIVTFCFLPVGWALQFVIGGIFSRLDVDVSTQPAVQALENASGVPAGIALGVVVIFLAPVAEEVLFRGILYPFIKQLGFPRIALWSTSVIFAAIHVNAVAFVPLLVLSVLLTTLYEHTGNLLAPITAHALFNAINFVMLFVADDFVRLLPSQQ
jgi:membrane protease YdiL (CAAX protease family)